MKYIYLVEQVLIEFVEVILLQRSTASDSSSSSSSTNSMNSSTNIHNQLCRCPSVFDDRRRSNRIPEELTSTCN
jgi:hypothetical protein